MKPDAYSIFSFLPKYLLDINNTESSMSQKKKKVDKATNDKSLLDAKEMTRNQLS